MITFIVNEIIFFLLIFILGYLLKVAFKSKTPSNSFIASASALIISSYFLIAITGTLIGHAGITFPLLIDFQRDIPEPRYDYDLENFFFAIGSLYVINMVVNILSLLKIIRTFTRRN